MHFWVGGRIDRMGLAILLLMRKSMFDAYPRLVYGSGLSKRKAVDVANFILW